MEAIITKFDQQLASSLKKIYAIQDCFDKMDFPVSLTGDIVSFHGCQNVLEKLQEYLFLSEVTVG